MNSSRSFHQNIKDFFKKFFIFLKKSCQVFEELFSGLDRIFSFYLFQEAAPSLPAYMFVNRTEYTGALPKMQANSNYLQLYRYCKTTIYKVKQKKYPLTQRPKDIFSVLLEMPTPTIVSEYPRTFRSYRASVQRNSPPISSRNIHSYHRSHDAAAEASTCRSACRHESRHPRHA